MYRIMSGTVTKQYHRRVSNNRTSNNKIL